MYMVFLVVGLVVVLVVVIVMENFGLKMSMVMVLVMEFLVLYCIELVEFAGVGYDYVVFIVSFAVDIRSVSDLVILMVVVVIGIWFFIFMNL